MYASLNPDGYLNLNNGILNLETLILTPASHQFFFTYRINVNYQAEDKPTPIWNKFISESVSSSDKDHLLQWLNGLFRGNRSNEMMLWIYGPSNSGKSVMLEIIKQLFRHGMSNVGISSFGMTFGLEPIAKAFVNIDADANDNCFGNNTTRVFKNLTDEDCDISVNGKNIKEVKIYQYL